MTAMFFALRIGLPAGRTVCGCNLADGVNGVWPAVADVHHQFEVVAGGFSGGG
jgi:hypothetical protein